MPDLIPKRLSEIEARSRAFRANAQAYTSNILYCDDVDTLLSALKRARSYLLSAAQSIAGYHESYGMGAGDLTVIKLAEVLGLETENGCSYEQAKQWIEQRIAEEGSHG